MTKRSAADLLDRLVKKAKSSNDWKKAVKKPPKTVNKYNQGSAGRAPEVKMYDTTPTANVYNGGEYVVTLNAMAQGTDYAERVGRKIEMTSCQVKLLMGSTTANLATISTAQLGGDKYRVALVYDKQTNQAAPAYTDIYATSGSNAMRNVNNLDRFDVLWVEEFAVCTAGPNNWTLDKYVKFNLDTRFDQAGSGVTGVITGGLFLVVSALNTTSGVTSALINGVTRVSYRDE